MSISFKSYFYRKYRCGYFKRINIYEKQIRNIFLDVFQLKPDKTNFIKLFVDTLENRSNSGPNFISKEDMVFFKSKCLDSASTIEKLLQTYNLEFYKTYSTRLNKSTFLEGYVDAIDDKKALTFQFSFIDQENTLKELDFHNENNYIYNKAMKKKNTNVLVCVPEKVVWITSPDNFNPCLYYTKSMPRKQGWYCRSCIRSCRSDYSSLNRLELKL